MSIQMTAAGSRSTPAPAADTPSVPRRRGHRAAAGGWLGVLPLLLFAAVALGLPVATMVIGAFTTPSTGSGEGALTTANMTATLQDRVPVEL